MDDQIESGIVKKFLYINRRAPHGTIYAHEALEVVLIGAAFEQDISLAFIDDGVFQLKKDLFQNLLQNFEPCRNSETIDYLFCLLYMPFISIQYYFLKLFRLLYLKYSPQLNLFQ